MEDDCDIIIIGAGIAGTACALRCARAGLSVLLLERAEIPGSKNLSGGRLYTHALAELLPQFHLTAPLERRITHESLSLLTPDGATTFSSLQPGGESWSVLRARFDPWLVAEAEKEGVECIPGATVDALYEENGRVCGVICGDDILRARYVVLAEGANSVLAERHGLVTRPAGGRCVAQLRQYRNFRARHGYGADWRTGGGTNADKRLPAPRAAKSVCALSSQRRAQPAMGYSTALSACSGAFATPWLVSGVACVNAGYFPRFMGSG